MPQEFDLIVIGAGPGGYTAALRAAQLGLRVACVDDWRDARQGPSPGGTCLNVGCIPSKALLESSAFYQRMGHDAAAHGINVGALTLDLGRMQGRKDKIVRQLTAGVSFLFKKNGVTFFHGRASFVSRDDHGFTLEVAGATGDLLQLLGKQVIVATGSVPRGLPLVTVDQDRVLDSTGALALTSVPARLGIIGAGVIGLELGSVWRRLGSEVTLLETQKKFLPVADRDIALETLKILTKDRWLTLELGIQLESVSVTAEGVKVVFHQGEEAHTLEVDRLVVAVGRIPCTQGLSLERIGLSCDERGAIPVDAHCRTAVPGLWAIGDVVRGPMLAHKAEDEGIAVAERLTGQMPEVALERMPWVIYTEPEVAWVGPTEEELRSEGRELRVGRFPFLANGRAKARGETRGFIKIIACAKTDRILSVHMLGPEASELIAEAVTAIEFGASSEDMARLVHAHPSLSEVFREAALGVDGRSLNS
ncbi:MAG: dihydrolipoyl dehydrogenase [Ferrovum sp.]|nr:dihydrolipoyl dehydrogenase [Ferrovum sp.]